MDNKKAKEEAKKDEEATNGTSNRKLDIAALDKESVPQVDIGWVQAPFLAKMCRFWTQKVYHFGPQKMSDFWVFFEVIFVCDFIRKSRGFLVFLAP